MQTAGNPSEMLTSALGYGAVLLVIGFVFYVWFAAALMSIARKTGTPGAGLAWVPIANVVLMCRIAGKSGWLTLLFLIPLVNIVIAIVLWTAIAQKRGKPAWTGVLIILPVVNLLAVTYIASGGAAVLQSAPAQAPPVPPPSGAPRTAAPLFCRMCGTRAEPGETYCGECGAAIVAPATASSAPPVPAAPPAEVGTKKSSMPMVAAAAAVVVVAGLGWFAWSRFGGHAQPRKQPALPARIAGVMKEFPVDSTQQLPARPSSVVWQSLKHGSALTVPAKSLPPGVTAQSLRKADSITSAVYHRQPKDSPVNVHVIDAPNATAEVGRSVASAVRAGAGPQSTVTGVQVANPSGGSYQGWHVQSPQTSTWVLQDFPGQMVIVVYAPDPSVTDVASRLASDVGNGGGLGDYPELQNTLWTLPADLPGGLVLSEMNTWDTTDLISPADLKTSVGLSGADAAQWEKIQQYLPQRVTTATYLDSARAPWRVAVGDFGGAMKAWSTWTLLRWTTGLTGLRSVSAAGMDGLASQQSDGSYMLVRSGPFIAVLSGPPQADTAQIAQLAGSLQIR